MLKAGDYNYVWEEYVLDMAPTELKSILFNPRVRTVATQSRCTVEVTNRLLHRRHTSYHWYTYTIIRITGPDNQSICKCNNSLERIIPLYKKRKEYSRRAPITIFANDIKHKDSCSDDNHTKDFLGLFSKTEADCHKSSASKADNQFKWSMSHVAGENMPAVTLAAINRPNSAEPGKLDLMKNGVSNSDIQHDLAVYSPRSTLDLSKDVNDDDVFPPTSKNICNIPANKNENTEVTVVLNPNVTTNTVISNSIKCDNVEPTFQVCDTYLPPPEFVQCFDLLEDYEEKGKSENKNDVSDFDIAFQIDLETSTDVIEKNSIRNEGLLNLNKDVDSQPFYEVYVLSDVVQHPDSNKLEAVNETHQKHSADLRFSEKRLSGKMFNKNESDMLIINDPSQNRDQEIKVIVVNDETELTKNEEECELASNYAMNKTELPSEFCGSQSAVPSQNLSFDLEWTAHIYKSNETPLPMSNIQSEAYIDGTELKDLGIDAEKYKYDDAVADELDNSENMLVISVIENAFAPNYDEIVKINEMTNIYDENPSISSSSSGIPYPNAEPYLIQSAFIFEESSDSFTSVIEDRTRSHQISDIVPPENRKLPHKWNNVFYLEKTSFDCSNSTPPVELSNEEFHSTLSQDAKSDPMLPIIEELQTVSDIHSTEEYSQTNGKFVKNNEINIECNVCVEESDNLEIEVSPIISIEPGVKHEVTLPTYTCSVEGPKKCDLFIGFELQVHISWESNNGISQSIKVTEVVYENIAAKTSFKCVRDVHIMKSSEIFPLSSQLENDHHGENESPWIICSTSKFSIFNNQIQSENCMNIEPEQQSGVNLYYEAKTQTDVPKCELKE